MIHEKKSVSTSIFVPFALLIVSIFAYVAIRKRGFGYFNYIFDNLLSKYIYLLEDITIVLIVFAATYLFVRLTSKLIKKYLEKKGTKADVKLFLVVYKYLVWFIVILVTLSLLFKQIGSLITSIGLIGFGITFALQKPILNFVGWITIVFSRTYKLGDIISINNINGKVYDIKIMYTSISELTDEGDPTGKSVSIPNEFVLTTPVINYTKGTSYVWDIIHIYITFNSDWKKALKIVEKTVQDFYDKNIKNDAENIFRDDFKGYDKVVVRFNIYEKGIHIKARYLVDFNRANELRTELSKILLDKLRVKGVILGKIEDIKSPIKIFD